MTLTLTTLSMDRLTGNKAYMKGIARGRARVRAKVQAEFEMELVQKMRNGGIPMILGLSALALHHQKACEALRISGDSGSEG